MRRGILKVIGREDKSGLLLTVMNSIGVWGETHMGLAR